MRPLQQAPAPSMRKRMRLLDQENKALRKTMDDMAQNMTHLVVRLEAVRTKFGLDRENVEKVTDEYIAKMAALQEQTKLDRLKAAATPIKEIIPMPPADQSSTPPEPVPAPEAQPV